MFVCVCYVCVCVCVCVCVMCVCVCVCYVCVCVCVLCVLCVVQHGESSLHIAAGYGRLNIVQLLLDHGAAIDLKDKVHCV